MRRQAIALLLVLLVSSSASAQLRRSRFIASDPNWWLSIGESQLEPWTVTDGSGGGSTWQFASVKALTGSLERSFGPELSVGIQGMHARMPMTYSGSGHTFATDANVNQALGMLHVRSPGSFHTIVELGAGSTLYSNFIRRDSLTLIGPKTTDGDLTLAYSGGFGYSLSSRLALEAIRAGTKVFHQTTGLASGDPTSAAIGGYRFVGRIGF